MAERRTWVVLIAMLAWAVAAACARGQDKRPELNRVEFGWNWTITTGRWMPVRVWLEGGPEASRGAVTVEFNADRTQRAQVVVPASTTPGKLTPIDLVVCLPADCGPVRVSYQSSLRRLPYQLDFSLPPTAGQWTRRPDQLGPMFGGTRGLFAHGGIGSIARAFPKPEEIDRSPSVNNMMVETFMSTSGDELAELRWRQLAATDVAGMDLPIVDRAYEGLETLVLDASKAANLAPRQREAITRWVESGGRLVLLTTDDSGAWRSWLPQGPAGELLDIGPPARLEPPGSIKEALGRPAITISVDKGRTAEQAAESPWNARESQVSFESKTPPEIPLRAQVTGRAIRLTPAGAAAGWRLGWTTSSGDSGLFAYGPLGMGLVTIVGADPESLPGTLDSKSTGRLWRLALDPALKNYTTTPFSGGDPGDGARTSCFNGIVSIPPLSDVVFNAILFSLIGLALLMGPIDWFVLKRYRAQQHSWLVALGWIILASIAAYIVPPRLRSGPPQINRLTNLDVVQASNDLASPASAWQDGLVGIFAAGPLAVEMDREAVSGSWWKGAAPSDPMDGYRAFNNRQRGLHIFGPLATEQVSTTSRDRENVPFPFAQPSWSYRTLAETSAPPPPPIRATITRQGEQVLAVVSGLPAADRIASLKVRGLQSGAVREVPAKFQRPSGEELIGTAAMNDVPQESGQFDPFTGSWSSTVRRDPGGEPWTLQLNGTLARRDAVNARLNSGAWCEVEIVMHDKVPSSRFIAEEDLRREGFIATELTTLRLLVPLEQPAMREHTERSGSGKEPGRD